MNPLKEHMVYVHSDIDGHIFYVGLGKNRRPWSSYGRNNHWWQKALKENAVHFEVELIASGLTKDEAREIEKDYINQYGLDNLTNIQH